MIKFEQIPDEVIDAADTITRLTAEVEDLGNRLHQVHRLWANNEHALREEVERLRAALKQIAGIDPWDDGEQGYVDKARAALEEK